MALPEMHGKTFVDQGAVPTTQGELQRNGMDLFLKGLNTYGRISQHAYVAVSSDYTITDTDGYTVFEIDASGGAVTITLPTASANLTRKLIFIKTDSSPNWVTIAPEGGDTLNGLTGISIMREQYDSITVMSLG